MTADSLQTASKSGLMRNIWNPWHGCRKYSEGCKNCYMFYLDRKRGIDGADIYKTKTEFYYPIETDKNGKYKLAPGESVMVCLTSDFFLEEADKWREEAWDMIRERRDVRFSIITKRVSRIAAAFPSDWGEGWDNVKISVTCENQKRADERMPSFLNIPLKHRGIVCAPLLEKVDVSPYLEGGMIEEVSCGGENYEGARPLDFEWVKFLRTQCEENNVSFNFFETGVHFIKDGKMFFLPKKSVQKEMCRRSEMNFAGKKHEYKLYDKMGFEV